MYSNKILTKLLPLVVGTATRSTCWLGGLVLKFGKVGTVKKKAKIKTKTRRCPIGNFAQTHATRMSTRT